MTKDSDRYAVFGNPVAHSRSPQIHKQFAAQTKQTLKYTAEHIEIGQFEQSVHNFINDNGKGLNITVPFKEDAWRCADKLTERAQHAGAVNTLILQSDNTLLGDTTDGIGLVRDLTQNHHIVLHDKDILIVGAGGAVRGALEAILEQKPASLLITNRTRSKAVQLADDFSKLADKGTILNGCGLDEISDTDFDIIINGTSSSLHGDIPALPATIFREGSTSYDMMYAARATPFMSWSAEHGVKNIFDGLGMLVEQAAESFYLWRNVKPETEPVIKLIRKLLGS